MNITATQQAGQNSASTTTASAQPAHGDHGFAHPAPMPMPMPKPMPLPYYNPFDQIRNLLDQLRMAIEQLSYPHQNDIFPPDPYQYGCGMDHGIPPVPVDPVQSRPRPKRGDAVGSIYTKSTGRTSISVSSVHRTFQDRDAAIAEAKRLAGSKGGAIHGVVANHARGTFTVVGLQSPVPITARQMGSVAGRDVQGLILDAIAFDAKTARNITSIEAAPAAPPAAAGAAPSVPAPPEVAH